ncbi:MAG TPA: ABC transporter ATP-binding protein, partial [Gammaproteobacteria bacterium]|nr:ABC transporter ATP-binding protein [Gammaproteobacteria bacterium]
MSLQLEDIDVSYGAHSALRSVSMNIPEPELVGVIGPNGAGKSTLLKAIAGLTQRSGSISVDSRSLERQPMQHVARLVAYCSQSSFPAWPVAVREVVSLGRLPYRNDPQARRDDAAAIDTAMERMGLTELAARPVDTLSGGERARALLARTLATQARVLLVDEPTSDLDPYHELKTMETLRDEARRGVTVI